MVGQVLHIFMCFIDDLSQLLPVDEFFKYPHGDTLLKLFMVLDHIATHYLSNR